VPPPRATTRKLRECGFELEVRFFMLTFGVAEPMLYYRKEFNTEHTESFERTENAEKKKQDSLSPPKSASWRGRLSPDRATR
jgi:hypothetical protein